MRNANIYTMASGPNGNDKIGMKFFFYGKESDSLLESSSDVYMVQLIIRGDTKDVSIVLRTTSKDSNSSFKFINLLRNGFQNYL